MSADLYRVLEKARKARAYDDRGDKDDRNKIAQSIFRNRANRLISAYGLTVETWWFASERSYVTQLKDAQGNQIGEADYNGDKDGAAVSHIRAIYEILKAIDHAKENKTR